MNRITSETRLNRLALLDYDVSQEGLWKTSATQGVTPAHEGSRDMDVRGVGSVSATPSIRPQSVNAAPLPTKGSPVSAPRDELQISKAGQMLDQLSQNSDVRSERIAQIKEAIANGTYDTDEKLEAALSRMFESLGGDLANE